MQDLTPFLCAIGLSKSLKHSRVVGNSPEERVVGNSPEERVVGNSPGEDY